MAHPMKVLIAAVLVGGLLGGSISANSAVPARAAGVTLTVYDVYTSPPAESAVVDKIYAAFMAAHPGISIHREAFQSDQLRTTVKTALASGTGPDLITYSPGPGWAGDLASAGLLRPLTSVAAQYGWNKRIVKAALQGASINGTLYGLPHQLDLIGMYYNKTLIAKAGLAVPQTYPQLLTFCRQAKAKGYIPMAFSDNPGWQAYHQFSMVTNNLLGPDAMHNLLYNHQGRWDTPQMVQAIKMYFVDLKSAGCFPSSVTGLAYADGNALFDTGRALLDPTGSWIANEVAQDKGFEMGMVPFPAINGQRAWVSGVGQAYYMSARTAHVKEAGEFLDYLISAPAVTLWEGGANLIVPVQFNSSKLNVPPVIKGLFNNVQSALHGTARFGFNIDVLTGDQFNTTMTNGFQAVLNGQKTPAQVAAQLQAAWQKTIKK
jgi:raffinose/stachyose/melibiose transport system substrate-binding protein